ncbi:dihydrolipoyllysine-residue acetyltransferase [Verminephrobacter eiseniae]|uniref:Acetyltransferase component of pyruvate dehydrogenase complex n=1 Tax=Verminephrobacter eiseniae (strain EF01-2) TaxID=391735 RepID=A1WJ64_VEREI|nr:dihydrolipoyllysine-residue acetyltransferase [Verminephrobacter eiseniae]ABM57671.1 pyruvate dehydrogenase complex dihydrolipoamide acetyltransferase [Verminephrobacter eiseniae EF01-2]MCW5283289.1 dihydrolipoyllysine-residue acetyltransferase [Verminephrobacter eiseniae]MCW5303605.1 dihydrolipoyllysine-residue acetyltransferase [Verminephrobacter eiseniae]MCW8178170.1 dihydrolipoyllysine-residue acetyltransferase [Verminephrobacter eiseniae]MCW8188399.1 dihydrolipoyllysine-residue acetylt
MALVDIQVPDIGDFDEVGVIELLVKPGDTIKVEQSLITVESDKASMEIPSSHAGQVKELRVQVGDKVKEGSVLLTLEVAGAAGAANAAGATEPATPTAAAAAPVAAPASPSTAAAPAGATPPAIPAQQPSPAMASLPHASPSVRKFARELGVPIAQVKGTGPKGRITLDDVQAFTRQVMSGAMQTQAQAARAPAAGSAVGLDLLPWPKIDFAKFGPVERKELGRIKKISGANLHRNWVLIPHVTNHDDADITELEAFRVQFNKENDKSGIKVTMLAFMIRAAVAALRKFPEFNASIDGEQLVLKNYFHIGFAADTPNGLMVPVIRDADQKGIVQISQEMAELAKKARDGKLAPAEMSGAGFSISSLGGIGGRYFTPIINAPEVAIMGVCKSRLEPQWDGKQFVPRLMLPLSLSWDHRVIDGAAAARFNLYFASLLADMRRIMM